MQVGRSGSAVCIDVLGVAAVALSHWSVQGLELADPDFTPSY